MHVLTCWLEDLCNEALFLCLPLDGGLVSLDLSQDVTRLHRVTLRLAPGSDVALHTGNTSTSTPHHVDCGGDTAGGVPAIAVKVIAKVSTCEQLLFCASSLSK